MPTTPEAERIIQLSIQISAARETLQRQERELMTLVGGQALPVHNKRDGEDSVSAQVAAAFEDAPTTTINVAELAKSLDANVRTVRAAVARMERKKLVVRIEPGRYRLAGG